MGTFILKREYLIIFGPEERNVHICHAHDAGAQARNVFYAPDFCPVSHELCELLDRCKF